MRKFALLSLVCVLLVAASPAPLILHGPGWNLVIERQECRKCVTRSWGAASLYDYAWSNGTIGILAHDYRSGEYFYDLEPFDLLTLDFPSGSRLYIVTEIHKFSRWKGDVLIDQDGRKWREWEVHDYFYTSGFPLVLQTCWGEGFWFVVAW